MADISPRVPPSGRSDSLAVKFLRGLGPLLPARFRMDVPVVPVVRLAGVIGAAVPLRPGLMLAGIARTLDKAFAVRGARAVALLINSPGGSPVQSHLIYQRIRQLAGEKNIPVLAVIEDVGASGGYMLACAGDEIICDRFSIVGSIGVVGGSFGFVKLLDKLGVERRLYTAGDRKAMLDPFLPEKPDDVKRIKAIQQDIHTHFIALVKQRRGGKLRGADKTLFSGEFWTGSAALEHGLVDSIGDLRSALRKRYGDKVRTPLIEPSRGFLSRRIPGLASVRAFDPQGLGTQGLSTQGLGDELISSLEARALWSRYGF